MKNDIKTALQNKEFEALKDKNRVILRWATGCGKSKMAIDLANNAANTLGCDDRRIKVAFIVAEKAHIKNWQNEFEKWGLLEGCMAVTICCYASLHKLRDTHFDILVLDEAHHCFTEKRMDTLGTIKADYIIMLSATLSYQKIAEIEALFRTTFTVSTVSLKKAISTDILPDPKVNIIPMELDNVVYNQKIVIGKNGPTVKWEDRGKYIYNKIPCVIKCTERQKYNYLTSSMDYWKDRYQRSNNQIFHNLWVNLGSQRKRFLGELKTTYVKQLISSFSPYKRFICFCASVAQANELDQENTISSKRTSTLNQQIIDAFNSKKLHRIYAVGMANEGLNLTDIQAGVIVQLDGKERLFVQKFGRSLRAQDPVTYIFYFKDTQDENYLRGALENIEAKYVKHISINQLLTEMKLSERKEVQDGY